MECAGLVEDGDGAAVGVGGEGFEDGEVQFVGAEDEGRDGRWEMGRRA